MNLREEFKDHFSNKAFKQIDGETRIIGKYGQLSKIGDLYDIWFICSERKLSMIQKNLSTNHGIIEDFNRLNGEAWVQTKDFNKALAMGKLCGIHKKRLYTDKEKQEMVKRLRKT